MQLLIKPSPIFSILLSFCFGHLLMAGPGDTIKVQSHDAVDMTWYGNYDRRAYFPTAGKTYRKVLMHYTMGCASGGCSDWDYTTQINLMRPTGIMDSTVASLDTISTSPLVVDTIWNVFEVIDPMELGRVITPYGGYMATGSNGYSNNWQHTYTFDVSDFVQHLQDSVDIRAHYSGWSSGFSVTLDFEFIEGDPVLPVIDVHTLYRGSKSYSNSSNFESTYFNAKDVSVSSGINSAKIYSTITGHGFDNNTNCAEFCVRTYTVNVNGTASGSATIWNDDCGSNPIYPQGGTWLYDRAGWCPGGKGDIHTFDVTSDITAGSLNSIDFDMQNYTWSGAQAPSYTVYARLVTYGAPNYSNDVAITEIVSPSLKANHRRYNPSCGRAVVRIKNMGANPLTTVDFTYGLTAANTCNYQWTGNLAFLEEAEITLPAFSWQGADPQDQTFSVTAANPNGQTDEFSFDNSMSSEYELPQMFNYDSLIVEIRTNAFGAETGYRLEDNSGNILYEELPGSFGNNSVYNRVFHMPKGCYVLTVLDSDEDGLSWWANNDGSGNFSFMHPSFPVAIYSVPKDFGTSYRLPFILGNSTDSVKSSCSITSVEDIQVNSWSANIFPNPNNGQFTLDLELRNEEDANVQIFSANGQLVFEQQYNAIKKAQIALDLKDKLNNGMYFLRIQTPTQQISKKFVVTK